MTELEQGIAALKAGQREQARKFLASAIRQDPNNERAWLWMYNAANNDTERLYCLEQAVRINPGNKKAIALHVEISKKNSQSAIGTGMSDDDFAAKMRGWIANKNTWPEMTTQAQSLEQQKSNLKQFQNLFKAQQIGLLGNSLQSLGCLLTVFVSIPACLCILLLLLQSP